MINKDLSKMKLPKVEMQKVKLKKTILDDEGKLIEVEEIVELPKFNKVKEKGSNR